MNPEAAKSISDVSVSIPSLREILEVLTLQAGFNAAVVVLGTTFLGIAAGTIGTFALLRKRALMGDALAHSGLPGLALAFILGAELGIGGKQLWLLLSGAAISGVSGVLCVQLLTRYSRLQEDAAIGAVLSCFFGAGVVLMSIIQSLGTGEEGGLHHFIFGQTAAINSSDALLTFWTALFAMAVSLFLFKEFRLVSFDPGFAQAEGWPVSKIDLAMMSVVVLVTVIGMQAVGLLLVVALLIVPAAGARFWTEKLQTMAWVSAIIGGLSGYLGSSASALLPRLPAGAVIVLVAGMIFLLSFCFAPARGVLARVLAHWRMSLRITEDHLLREIYEVCEQRRGGVETLNSFVNLDALPIARSWSRFYRGLVLWQMSSKGLLETRSAQGRYELRLLAQGILQAQCRVRNHRLWEEYLASQTELPVSHIDYSADFVEHVLSPQIVRELEQSLREKAAMPVSAVLPQSIHPLGEK